MSTNGFEQASRKACQRSPELGRLARQPEPVAAEHASGDHPGEAADETAGSRRPGAA